MSSMVIYVVVPYRVYYGFNNVICKGKKKNIKVISEGFSF